MYEILKTFADNRIQIYAILGSLFLLAFIVRLIQKRRLKMEYALLWILSSVLFFAIAIFKPVLEAIAFMAGILYAPAALLLLLILVVLIILIHYSTVISKLSEQNKTLVQEVAILKHKMDTIHHD